jgi:HAD superfamily hydrolase (TIGR01509 family)
LTDLSSLAEPEALVFDLDGTLVDTVETRIAAWLETFRQVELPAERDFVARLIGADGKRLAREVATVAGRQLDDQQAEAIDHRAGEIYDQLNTTPRPLPGATALLHALEASDMRWAIATSSRREQVQVSVAALELRRQPRIIDGSHVEHAKPAPDLLLLAAEELSAAPADCWYVGDATWDMVAARAAGMPGIGIASGAASDQMLLDAGARLVTTLGALVADLTRRRLVPAIE